jgi:E3 ubiquitin-protein ligase HUWE1
MDDERKSWIWRALTELENENPGFLSELLQFLTGSSRIPVGGLQNMDPKLKFEIAQKPGADFETSRCPVAHTCINQLDLPLYDSVETLKAKLLYAATNKSGFALR